MLARLKVTAAWRPFESLRLGVQTREKFINRKRGAQQVDANDGEAVTRHTANISILHLALMSILIKPQQSPARSRGGISSSASTSCVVSAPPESSLAYHRLTGDLEKHLPFADQLRGKGGGFHRSPSVANRSCEKDRYCFGGDRDHCVDAHAHSDLREAQDQRLGQDADVLEICELRQQLSLLN